MPARKKVPESLLDVVIRAAGEKKGENILSIDFSGMRNAVCTYFVVCHGTSGVHVEAIADAVIYEVKKATGLLPWHREGFENAEWILLDYIDVVVHIFKNEARDFYDLESLWADAKITHVEPKN